MPPTASIVIPTRGRPGYLEVALASVVPQAAAAGAEVIVVDDGQLADDERLAASNGARYVTLGSPRGLNVARNAGLHAAAADLVVFVDDDIEAHDGWLAALLGASRALPQVDVFTGPVRARFDGRQIRSCGREGPPITFLDLGDADSDAEHAWGVNMAIRRRAFERFGVFDERLSGGGDEEEWQRRYRAAGGRIRYVAAASLDHRRAGRDTRLTALMRAAHRRGAEVRRFDVAQGSAPSLATELRGFAGCVWHAGRRRCENGLVMAAHTAGRIGAALGRRRRGSSAAPDDFLSGESGTVGGRRDLLRSAADAVLDLGPGRRLRADGPARSVLVLSVVRDHNRDRLEAAATELRGSRHAVQICTTEPGELGKFENLNSQLAAHPVDGHDWLVLLDDDVRLPAAFLDRFIFLAERFDLRVAQPAHRLRSHAAWRLTRRRPLSLVRETAFVEIGPVTALHRDTFGVLLPFPPLRMGWGLDAHWAAIARDRGWRIGIVDATPIAHVGAAIATAYSQEEAVAEARDFLADREYLPRSESQRTLAVHRRS